MSTSHTGHCLCQAVSFTTTQAIRHLSACHCAICRGWGGGPYLSVDCGPDVTFCGEEYITRYASSDWAERGFCRHCGSHLFYRLKRTGQHMLAAGLFTELPPQLTLDLQVFIDQKPPYYDFANQTRNLTAADIMARFSGNQSRSQHSAPPAPDAAS